MQVLGIDIGGSGVKGAIVDTAKGSLLTERVRHKTPEGASLKTVLELMQRLLAEFEWRTGPVGIGFPGVIRHGCIRTAVNFHPGLVGVNLREQLGFAENRKVSVLNDADAAGLAEMRFGAGRAHCSAGTVLMVTIGTGIGTVLFVNGQLVPNLELGHIEFSGHDAEALVSERARKKLDLSWKQWGALLNAYLERLEFLLQPDFIILGGGGVKRREKFQHYITIETPWAFAETGNHAGLIGAALAAAG